MRYLKLLMRFGVLFCLMLGSPYWPGPGVEVTDEIPAL